MANTMGHVGTSPRGNPHLCEDCGEQFPSRSRAARHARLSGHMAGRHCGACEQLFDDHRALQQHEKHSRHHSSVVASTTASAPSSASSARNMMPTSPSSPVPPHQRRSRQTAASRPQLGIPTDTSVTSTAAAAPWTPRKKRAKGESPSRLGTAGAVETPAAHLETSTPDQNGGNIPKDPLSMSELDVALQLEVSRDLDTKNMDMPKSSEEKPRPSKPLVFSSAPIYPSIEVYPTSDRIMHGNCQYTQYSPLDQDSLFDALQLRCHKEERLLSRRFFIPGTSLDDVSVPKGINAADYIATPPPSSRITRRVVALDCEMVGILYGKAEDRIERSELAQLCVIDVLTGEILVDKLVRPNERVFNWRTRYSGVSYPAILAANQEGRLLRGWRAARAELLSYIDSDTILVGHDMTNDLHSLRLAHSRVIDTTLQTAEAVWGDVDRPGRIWGLKDLAKTLLGLDIQVGKRGHDCVEDTLATRELVLWCLRCPEELHAWASRMREELEGQRIEREERLAIDRERREEENAKRESEEAGEQAMANPQGWPLSPMPPLGFNF